MTTDWCKPSLAHGGPSWRIISSSISQPSEPVTIGMQYQRASAKLDSGAVRQARNALEGGGRAPATPTTLAEITKLLAVDMDHAEREATAEACERVAAATSKQQGPPTELVKRLCREVATGAEPGPSGWRNADISWICRADHGPQAWRWWMQQWHSASVTAFTRNLWSSALVTPLDCGQKR